MTEEYKANYIAQKKVGYKFVQEYGISYHAFKAYLRKHHGKGLKDIKGLEDMYVDWYKEDITDNKKPSFETQYGVNYGTFRDWLKRTYDINMSDLYDEIRQEYVDEYIEYRDRTRVSSYTYFEEKYGVHRKTFYSWLEREYGMRLSQLNEEEREYYVNECKATLKYRKSK